MTPWRNVLDGHLCVLSLAELLVAMVVVVVIFVWMLVCGCVCE